MNKRSKKKMSKNKRNKRNKNINLKGGFKIVLPGEFFNVNMESNYRPFQLVNPMNKAVSHGYIHKDFNHTGPDLHKTEPVINSQKGGVLPAEYFGGDSGRYFEAGSPQLETCTHAYGRNITSSNGVVMNEPHNMWMGPNLATFPNFKDMTGGSRKKTKKNKKNRKNKRKSRKN